MDQTFSWPFSPSRYTSGLYLVLRVFRAPYQVLRVSRVPGLVLRVFRVPGMVLRVPGICLVLRFSGEIQALLIIPGSPDYSRFY